MNPIQAFHQAELTVRLHIAQSELREDLQHGRFLGYSLPVKFEFDPHKSAGNKVKHGLDFLQAQALWRGWTLEIPAKGVDGQFRYAVIGEITGKVHTAIITYRGGAIRIISVRESNKTEADFYERKKAERR